VECGHARNLFISRRVSETLSASLHKSLRKMSENSQNITIHVLLKLLAPDYRRGRHYCDWLLANFEEDANTLDMASISDEACYHSLTFQNSRMWSAEEIPLEPMKILFLLSVLKCCVYHLAVGLLDQFSTKTPLTGRAALT
jgi:hypothetical protein